MFDIFQEQRKNYFSHVWWKQSHEIYQEGNISHIFDRENSHDIFQEKNVSHMFEVVEECSATETFVAEEREAASLKQI